MTPQKATEYLSKICWSIESGHYRSKKHSPTSLLVGECFLRVEYPAKAGHEQGAKRIANGARTSKGECFLRVEYPAKAGHEQGAKRIANALHQMSIIKNG